MCWQAVCGEYETTLLLLWTLFVLCVPVCNCVRNCKLFSPHTTNTYLNLVLMNGLGSYYRSQLLYGEWVNSVVNSTGGGARLAECVCFVGVSTRACEHTRTVVCDVD